MSTTPTPEGQTPRTDNELLVLGAVFKDARFRYPKLAEFTKKLERELNAAKAQPAPTHCDSCDPSFSCWSGEDRCRKVPAPSADLDVTRAQEGGNALYRSIVAALRPHFPPDTRDLEWDVLPSTLKSLATAVAKEREEKEQARKAHQIQQDNYLNLYEAVVGTGTVAGPLDPIKVVRALRAENDRLKEELKRLETGLWSDKTALLRELEELRTLRTSLANSGLVEALEPVYLIHARAPQTPAESDDFERGCPLTKSQIRAMQSALTNLRAILAEQGTQTTEGKKL